MRCPQSKFIRPKPQPTGSQLRDFVVCVLLAITPTPLIAADATKTDEQLKVAHEILSKYEGAVESLKELAALRAQINRLKSAKPANHLNERASELTTAVTAFAGAYSTVNAKLIALQNAINAQSFNVNPATHIKTRATELGAKLDEYASQYTSLATELDKLRDKINGKSFEAQPKTNLIDRSMKFEIDLKAYAGPYKDLTGPLGKIRDEIDKKSFGAAPLTHLQAIGAKLSGHLSELDKVPQPDTLLGSYQTLIANLRALEEIQLPAAIRSRATSLKDKVEASSYLRDHEQSGPAIEELRTSLNTSLVTNNLAAAIKEYETSLTAILKNSKTVIDANATMKKSLGTIGTLTADYAEDAKKKKLTPRIHVFYAIYGDIRTPSLFGGFKHWAQQRRKRWCSATSAVRATCQRQESCKFEDQAAFDGLCGDKFAATVSKPIKGIEVWYACVKAGDATWGSLQNASATDLGLPQHKIADKLDRLREQAYSRRKPYRHAIRTGIAYLRTTTQEIRCHPKEPG